MPEMIEHSHHHHEHDTGNSTKKWLAALGLGTALVAGAIILSPYVLPLIHVGSPDLAKEALSAMHGTGLGNGLAGTINTALNGIPYVGAAIAKGGLASAAASGVVGIGGVLLGQFIEKKENGKTGIKWGNVIRYGALITSALIAMPTVLSGISVGIVYCCAALSGIQMASAAVTFLAGTLGSVGATNLGTVGATGASAATTALPHLLTCGISAIPASTAFALSNKKERADMLTSYSDNNNMKSPVSVSIKLDKPLEANRPCKVTLSLNDAMTNQPITERDLATVHMNKLHVLIADQRLKDYQHVHPVASGKDGEFTFSFTPKTNNGYHIWSDFTLAGNSNDTRILTDIPSETNRQIHPVLAYNSDAEKNGLYFQWNFAEPLQKGVASVAEITVSDATGNPVVLDPVMGASAHLVGFSADGKSLIHAHPLNDVMNEAGATKLRFHIEPENAGATQFYLQVKHQGQDIYVPFGRQVKQSSVTDSITQPHHQHALHAGHAM